MVIDVDTVLFVLPTREVYFTGRHDGLIQTALTLTLGLCNGIRCAFQSALSSHVSYFNNSMCYETAKLLNTKLSNRVLQVGNYVVEYQYAMSCLLSSVTTI